MPTTTGVQLPLFGFDSTVIPDIDFCVKDASQIEADVITNYENYFYLYTQITKTLARGDPVRLFFETIIYQLVVQRSIVDSTGKQNLLKYAKGANLDNVGAKWGVRGGRTKPTYATTVLQFTLANNLTLTSDSVVPIGTQAQTGEHHVFATTAEGTIKAGSVSVDVPAKAMEAGSALNGLVVGQISLLVSWHAPFLVSVSNTTVSSGGSDLESDDHLRARIWMAPESFSTAGPKEAYESWAASANNDIMDVSVWSAPEVAGQVYVYPLMTGGKLPDQAVLDEVYAILNADKIRPLTDQVFVQAPLTYTYDPSVQFWITAANAQFSADIEAAVMAAYQGYIEWQRSKIGRDVNPSKCDQLLIDAGAKRTNIPGSAAFLYHVLDEKTLAVEDPAATCTYEGLEPE
jgi:phage-related baseplate assembly protein